MPPSLPDWSVTHVPSRGPAGREKRLPQNASADPGVEAGWEHPCIPWQGSREGQQQQERLEAAGEGRKEERTGPGSRGARPVGAARLFSMGGAYLCHRLGLITGTCLQPRRLPGSVITSNWAGLGSRAHPRASTALPKPLSPQCHPPVLVALGWLPCASRGGGQAGPAEPPEGRRGLINSQVPRDYTNEARRFNEPSRARECHPHPTGREKRGHLAQTRQQQWGWARGSPLSVPRVSQHPAPPVELFPGPAVVPHRGSKAKVLFGQQTRREGREFHPYPKAQL